MHTYATGEKPRGAFSSDCSDWEDEGHDLLFFQVRFENVSQRTVSLRLNNFVLVSRDGRSFGPVNVRALAKYPSSFLAKVAKVPPGARWQGVVTFDGNVIGLVPDALSYVDGRQTLTEVFKGRHDVVETME